ncbi:hypothetical protein [Plantibacter cousiniae (nom. nud.)]|uniref:Uncharacterized protein n=1 Tax=Plantibacter cousiniae (nom. nud.) TaxID=199709 RepID=A0ABY1LFL6_9MICO|nr:hypothetical protein [Plantibacter cousiniae]SKC35776.1 hypothetical protein SAMN06295973_0040 [Plantibacter cousiniae]
MDHEDAQDRLNQARDASRRSARQGAFTTAILTAVLIIALGVVVDLDMVWLLGLVAIGFVALSLARPVKLRLDWSDRTGVLLLTASGVAVAVVYVVTQWIARSAGVSVPNTVSAVVAAVVVFAVCLPALVRLAIGSTPLGGRSGSRDA